MKIPYKFLLIGFALTVLSSCWEDYYIDIEQDVATDEVVYNVDAAGETISIPIRCNTDWFIWNPPYWIIPDVESGSGNHELSVEISRNTSYARTGVINIVAGTEVKTVTVFQEIATSGKLRVTTGNCYKYGAGWTNYTLGITFYVTSAHLASEAGVIVNNRTYKLSQSPAEGYNYMEIDGLSSMGGGGSYQAYAKNKNTGKFVYGSTENY